MKQHYLQSSEATPTRQAVVHISPQRVLVSLLVVSVSLIVISFFGVVILDPYEGFPYDGDSSATPTNLARLVLRFDVMGEGNIPSWFSGAILFFSAVLLMLIALYKHAQREPFRWSWSFLSLTFFVFSLDEIAYLHEALGNIIRREAFSEIQIGWIIPGTIFVLLFSIGFIPFLLHLPSRTRLLLIVSAVIFLAGALGLEIMDNFLLNSFDVQLTIILISNHFQDLLEMIGVSLFIYTLLSYISTHMNPLQLNIR